MDTNPDSKTSDNRKVDMPYVMSKTMSEKFESADKTQESSSWSWGKVSGGVPPCPGCATLRSGYSPTGESREESLSVHQSLGKQ